MQLMVFEMRQRDTLKCPWLMHGNVTACGWLLFKKRLRKRSPRESGNPSKRKVGGISGSGLWTMAEWFPQDKFHYNFMKYAEGKRKRNNTL